MVELICFDTLYEQLRTDPSSWDVQWFDSLFTRWLGDLKTKIEGKTTGMRSAPDNDLV